MVVGEDVVDDGGGIPVKKMIDEIMDVLYTTMGHTTVHKSTQGSPVKDQLVILHPIELFVRRGLIVPQDIPPRLEVILGTENDLACARTCQSRGGDRGRLSILSTFSRK